MNHWDPETIDVIERRRLSDEGSTVLAGCLSAIISASVTAVMLLVNGALVLAVLAVVGGPDDSWIRDKRVSQFLLYTLPVGLVIAQWMMIDYVRTRFVPR